MDQQNKKPSDHFREIAEKIDKNDLSDFGGAFLLVPPEGQPLSNIFIGSKDPVAFLALLKTKVETLMNEAEQREKQRQGFVR